MGILLYNGTKLIMRKPCQIHAHTTCGPEMVSVWAGFDIISLLGAPWLIWCNIPFGVSSVAVSLFWYCITQLVGSEDGKIHVWNGETGMKVAVLDGKHTGPITCLQFNPKFMTFASACSNMVRRPHVLLHSSWQMGSSISAASFDTKKSYFFLYWKL